MFVIIDELTNPHTTWEDTDDKSDISHIFCEVCDVNLAFCGADITDEEIDEWGEVRPEDECVVCNDLNLTHACED